MILTFQYKSNFEIIVTHLIYVKSLFNTENICIKYSKDTRIFVNPIWNSRSGFNEEKTFSWNIKVTRTIHNF